MVDTKAPTVPDEAKGLADQLETLTGLFEKNKAEMTGAIESFQNILTATTLYSKGLEFSNQILGDTATNVAGLNERLILSTSNTEALRKTQGRLTKGLFDLSKESRKYGITIKENYGAVAFFSKQNVKLLDIYEKNKVGLAGFAGRMAALKVPLKVSGDMVGQLTSHLDMNVDQLDSSGRALVRFATQTGQSVKEVVESYTKSIKSFMDFLDPKEMNQNFMQFQVMARRMGTEGTKLYELATKFDTIEQAQQMGAKMNQIFSTLGIEFNALQLQEMEPKQRIDYIAAKTRLALKKAKQMGGREGRLLVRALGGAGLGDFATVRGLASEGGGRRATTAFERGGGRAIEATKEEEERLAARLNFYNIEKANIKYSTELAQRQLGIFKEIENLTISAPEKVLEAGRVQRVATEQIAQVQVRILTALGDAALQKLKNIAAAPVPAKVQAELARVGVTNAQNISTMAAALTAAATSIEKKITDAGTNPVDRQKAIDDIIATFKSAGGSVADSTTMKEQLKKLLGIINL